MTYGSLNGGTLLSAAPVNGVYLGSTEGADQISEETADLIDGAVELAYIEDADGCRSFFDIHEAKEVA